MIIDKKGKLFGKVSIIDLLIILVIIVIGILASKVLMSSNDSKALDTIYYTVEFKEVNQDFIDEIKKDTPVFDAIKYKAIGRVDNYEVKPFTRILKDHEEGAFREVEVEDKYNVYLKVKADAVLTESTISVNNYEIRIGKKVPIKGKGFIGETYVTGLEIMEAK